MWGEEGRKVGGTEQVGDVVRCKRQGQEARAEGKGPVRQRNGREGGMRGGDVGWEVINRHGQVLVIIKAGRCKWQMAVGSGRLLAVAGTWTCEWY